MADNSFKTNDKSSQPPNAVTSSIPPHGGHKLLRLARLACLGVYELFLGAYFAVPYFWKIRRRALRILRYLRDAGSDPAWEAAALREKRSTELLVALGLVMLACWVVIAVKGKLAGQWRYLRITEELLATVSGPGGSGRAVLRREQSLPVVQRQDTVNDSS